MRSIACKQHDIHDRNLFEKTTSFRINQIVSSRVDVWKAIQVSGCSHIGIPNAVIGNSRIRLLCYMLRILRIGEDLAMFARRASSGVRITSAARSRLVLYFGSFAPARCPGHVHLKPRHSGRLGLDSSLRELAWIQPSDSE